MVGLSRVKLGSVWEEMGKGRLEGDKREEGVLDKGKWEEEDKNGINLKEEKWVGEDLNE